MKKNLFHNVEKILLLILFLLPEGLPNPSYVDIGAYHPYKFNNTALFYNKGSRGINIEPDNTQFNFFLTHRKDDINLNFGIGSKEEEKDFYIFSNRTLSTFSKKEADLLVEKN